MPQPRPPWRLALPALSIASLAALLALAACVVETEPTPRRPLLRDVMAAQAASAPPPAAGVVVVGPALPAADPVLTFEAPPPPAAFQTCQADAECVAVLRNGCCHDGRNVAINAASVEAYKASFTCGVPEPRCPMHLVLDRRVPACDTTAHACKLVEPAASP